MATLAESKKKFEEGQDVLHAIFEKAKNEKGEYDFDRVEMDGCKTTQEKLARIHKMEEDLNKQFDECKGLQEAESAYKGFQDKLRLPGGNNLPVPNGSPANQNSSGNKGYVTLGEQFVKCAMYLDYVKNKRIGDTSTLDWGLAEIKMLSFLSAYEVKTLFERGAGWSPESVRIPGFTEKVSRPVQLLDIIPSGTTGQASIKYMEETTRVHNSAERAEGTAFAESQFALTERTQPVEKITDSVPTTDEQLEDVQQAESYLTERLQYGIRQRLDGQAAVGDGISPNLKGILAHTIQTQAKASDPTPDAFYKAMAKIRFVGRAVPTHAVIHPNDWTDIRLLRTADGIYIWGAPMDVGPERLWGLPVVQNDALTEGTGLVGSFLPSWIMLFNRRGIDVQIGYIGNQFTEGKRTIRADMRAALVVFRPAAFASVTGI